jgi:hypothetical protein
MKTLLSHIEEYRAILEIVESFHGEITPEIETKIELLAKSLGNKVDKYEALISRLEAEQEIFKHKKQEMARIEKACEETRDFLLQRLKVAIEHLGPIDGEEYSAKLVTNPPKLIADEKLIPDGYKIKTIVTTLDKELIRAALKNGDEVPGAFLVQGTRVKFSPVRKALK